MQRPAVCDGLQHSLLYLALLLQCHQPVSNPAKHAYLTVVTRYDLVNAANVTGRQYRHSESNFQNTSLSAAITERILLK